MSVKGTQLNFMSYWNLLELYIRLPEDSPEVMTVNSRTLSWLLSGLAVIDAPKARAKEG